MPNLRQIDLSSTIITKDAFESFLQVPAAKRLEVLDLSRVRFEGREELAPALIAYLKQSFSGPLRELRLEGSQIAADHCEAIFKAVIEGNHSEMTSLDLSNIEEKGDGVKPETLSELLKTHQKLRILGLPRSKENPSALSKLLKTLVSGENEKNSKIQELALFVRDEEMPAVAEVLQKARSLKKLVLLGEPSANASLVLTQVMANNSTLEELDLADKEITKSVLQGLISVPEGKKPALHKLKAKLDIAGWELLTRVMENPTSIQELQLRSYAAVGISENQVEALFHAFSKAGLKKLALLDDFIFEDHRKTILSLLAKNQSVESLALPLVKHQDLIVFADAAKSSKNPSHLKELVVKENDNPVGSVILLVGQKSPFPALRKLDLSPKRDFPLTANDLQNLHEALRKNRTIAEIYIGARWGGLPDLSTIPGSRFKNWADVDPRILSHSAKVDY